MVGLSKVDRDSCRFFWPENPFDRGSKINTFRFRVVLFGPKASPLILNATLRHHFSKINTFRFRVVLFGPKASPLILNATQHHHLQ